MDRPDLPLNALRVFEVAMRQGSFTRAATELRVTQAAVSHQIARLEDLLGTVLFQRTPQGLVPTDEGRALYEGFAAELALLGIPTETGEFGADMAVSLVNDGPVTIWIDTENQA